MKEVRFFYTPEPQTGMLPDEEAAHAVRVLRMAEGDELFLMDGRGTFFRAEITEASKHRCGFCIVETLPQPNVNGNLICIWLWVRRRTWTAPNGWPRRRRR